ncbi:hypothetical protein Pan181_28130 [Aeoliella mucimassa]|uniref:Uncharacterized protein n=1 Tax=Aeoliella mucimassa TaxID=2527972 RepID=A0A518APF0_9BACT|nr:hypothetical protein Pan181_28130 [Aeoliella mucimassa]
MLRQVSGGYALGSRVVTGTTFATDIAHLITTRNGKI